MYCSFLTEYGIPWVINRSLYSVKLKMMSAMPITEHLFEKKVEIKQIDIFQVDTNGIEAFLNDFSLEVKNEIVMIADHAAEGKIYGFSSVELNYGNPINWHLNPITKIEVDKYIKWYKIPDFDPVRGDIKAVWEASRFTHFFYFARAYMITKDAKYYKAFSTQMSDWINENSYSYGANYKCGQEATIRMINALIAYSVFNNYGLASKADEIHLKKLVEDSYKKVKSNFFYAHKCIKNNHTLSEITGLIVGAWCCEDETALKKAYQFMDREIGKQFMSDGGYIQYSFNYQRFALQIMEFVLKISETTGIDLSDHSKMLIEKSVLQMYQLQDETGDVPNYGSNDGALIFPVTICDYRDFRPLLNTVYAVLKGKRLYEKGNYDEEILWFSNIDIGNIPHAGIKRQSIAYRESGFYSLRHTDGHLMVVLQDFKTRPAQMDQMHIDLWHKGVNILCDSGTYSYATDLGKQLALTSAHNTVKIRDKEQMKKHGPFLIYGWPSASDVAFTEYHFKGTMTSKNGYSHTRIINKESVGYSIEDYVVGDIEKYEILFHTPCEVKRNERGLDLYYNNKLIAKIITKNEIQISQSYRSLYYLETERIIQISIGISSKSNSLVRIELV
jgi:hypothetical protein